MKTRIEWDPAMPLQPTAGKLPHVAMGEDIRLLAGIGNNGAQDLVIEDPKATQLGAYAPFRLSLHKLALDKCFAEGLYTVAFSYGGTRSAPATLAVESAPGSVLPLLAILADAGKDMWVRREALKWLRKLKPDFAFDFAKPDTQEFRAWWDVESKQLDIKARFRSLH